MSESELLARAFGALGMGPSWRELELVGNAVRESGDEEAIATLMGDFDEVVEIATAAGSGGFTALALVTEVGSPGAHADALRGVRPEAEQ